MANPNYVSNVELGGESQQVAQSNELRFTSGARVQNKETIEQDISRFLGHEGKMAAIEFICRMRTVPSWLCGGWGMAFGHAVIARMAPVAS